MILEKMSHYEIVNIVLSALAIIMSLLTIIVSWLTKRENRLLQKTSNELQKDQSELARKQLDMIKKEELLRADTIALQKAHAELAKIQLAYFSEQQKQRLTPKLSLDFVRQSRGYRLVLKNIGNVSVNDVTFSLEPLEGGYNSPLASDYHDKLPARVLEPGASVSVLASVSDDVALAYNAEIQWTNADGNRESSKTYVCVP
ncbi:hypothetical protein ABMY36_21090 [Vibrio vulnificus]|uniref:hypothetical protein n=1 Tax=Vibrio vulnificus TaxID=672 RepID=UPI001DFD4EED|nr:hypothetical protein [Vibrio vulnificus]EKO5192359.1 hypothetical protein [Vibrio vulnificus]